MIFEYTELKTISPILKGNKTLKKLIINKHDCFESKGEFVRENPFYKKYDCEFTIPKWIYTLENLESLSFKDCELINLPNQFQKLSNLKELTIIHPSFTEFPPEIANLKSLETLYYLGAPEVPVELKSVCHYFE